MKIAEEYQGISRKEDMMINHLTVNMEPQQDSEVNIELPKSFCVNIPKLNIETMNK